jgi:hypothetical protein
MKLFSQHGTKVLDAPVDAKHAYPSFRDYIENNKGVQQLQIQLEVYTTARDTQYTILLDYLDIKELKKILELRK